MILDKIILENFCAYGGRQEAVLTPIVGKPIILFGGMNGGGKTTLLDAIQLAFYGPRARTSNRGKLSYKDYLCECIHRNRDPREGASIILQFRRIIEGQERHFEIQRSWCKGDKGIEESIHVIRDGQPDDIITEHWNEVIEAYLPSSIAHLFFFDGEQIKELAEGGNAAEILGIAIHSLLGLDLVDRLETDLKVFERRKKSDGLDPETAKKLKQIQNEYDEIYLEGGNVAQEAGSIRSQVDWLEKELKKKEEKFRNEGGELFQRRKELEEALSILKLQKAAVETQFRELVAGPLPFLLVKDLILEVQELAQHETEVRRTRLLLDALEKRDSTLLTTLKAEKIDTHTISSIENILKKDRGGRIGLAEKQLILDADEDLATRIAHLQNTVLPVAEKQIGNLTANLIMLDEKIIRLEAEQIRVPTEEQIAVFQEALDAARDDLQKKRIELEGVEIRKKAIEKQRIIVEAKLNKFGVLDIDTRFADDARMRMLKHSQKVRNTLEQFRNKVVQKHVINMEALMLESFCKLLRKRVLVSTLKIDDKTFEPTLTSPNGIRLPFDRLSAGEKQLLATSMLWGLARASGRPVPAIIDTPLGRLDSSHRRHLTERYFPNASHQVLLLSTDEEIVGNYYETLKPYITRSYLLVHNEIAGNTSIQEGYFVS